MKVILTSLVGVLALLSTQGVNALREGRSLRAKDKESNVGSQERKLWEPVLFISASGSCGCSGDAVDSILRTYHQKRKQLLPLQVSPDANCRSTVLSLLLSKYMFVLTKIATGIISNVDCGDCTGIPINYCGKCVPREMPSIEMTKLGTFHIDIHQDLMCPWEYHPTTFDCCYDVNLLRDITKWALCALAEESYEWDRKSGLPVLDTTKFLMYINNAWDIFDQAITKFKMVGERFCLDFNNDLEELLPAPEPAILDAKCGGDESSIAPP